MIHTLPDCVIITDEPLRTKMMAAHHMEQAALVSGENELPVYVGNYRGVPMALVTYTGGVNACIDALQRQRVKHIVHACTVVSDKHPPRTVYTSGDDTVLHIMTVAENTVTGETMDGAERVSRLYDAVQMAFDTLSNTNN